MHKFTVGRLLLSLLFLGSAVGVVWFNLSWLVSSPQLSFDTKRAGGSLAYTVSRRDIAPGSCVNIHWQAEGIQEIYFNDQPTVGEDQREICASTSPAKAPDLRLKVVFGDSIPVIYYPQVMFHPDLNLPLPIALALVGFVVLLAPLESAEIYRRVGACLSLFIPIGAALIVAFVAVMVINAVVTAPTVDEFINKPWYSLIDTSRCGYYEVSPYGTRPERVMFAQLEHINNDEGHALIFGTSNAVESLLPYSLTADQQAHILNLAMGASTPLEYEAVLKYIDEEKNLLHPKQGKTGIVLAFWSAVFAQNAWHYIYQNAFRLYDKFDLIETSNIDWSLKPTQNVLSPVLMAQSATASLFSRNFPLTWRRVFFPEISRTRLSGSAANCRPLEVDDATLARDQFWSDYHGGSNYNLPNEATVPLERMGERARSSGVPIIIINLPLPTWLQDSDFQKQYLDYMNGFAERYNAPIYDLTHLLQNNQFRDTAHPTIDGRETLSKEIINILEKEGLLTVAS